MVGHHGRVAVVAGSSQSKETQMAVSPKLVDFVVDLVVDSAKRERFHYGDAAAREEMMSEAGLNDTEKAAIRDGNVASLEKMLNTQIIIPPAIKKAPARKPKPSKKAPAKKAPKKKGTASRAAAKKAAKKKR
jgi:hypothetical protein